MSLHTYRGYVSGYTYTLYGFLVLQVRAALAAIWLNLPALFVEVPLVNLVTGLGRINHAAGVSRLLLYPCYESSTCLFVSRQVYVEREYQMVSADTQPQTPLPPPCHGQSDSISDHSYYDHK